MRSPLPRQTWLTLAQTAGIGLIFYFIITHIARHAYQLQEIRFQWRAGALLLSVILKMIYSVNLTLIWWYITKKNHCPLPAARSTVYWVLSMAGKYIPSKVFLYAGRLYFYKKEDRPAAQVTFSLYLEIFCAMLAAVFVYLLSTLIVTIDVLEPFKPMIFLSLLVLMIIIHPKFSGPLMNWILRLTGKTKIPVTMNYYEILSVTFLYMLNYAFLGLALFFFIRSFYPLSANQIPYITGANALAGVLGMLAFFTPSGLGVRDGVLAFTLAAILPGAVAGLIALTTRLWLSVIDLILFALALMAAKIKRMPIGI